MSAQSLFIILRLISLMVFFRNGISAFLINCEKAIIHFPEYKCRDQALFDRGANGITFIVFKDKEPYILKVQEVKELNQLKKANTDVQFLRLFQGEKYIIQLFESLIADGYLFELLEFGENGNLLSYFNWKREFFANRKNKLELFWKILQGVSTIHKKGVVHADLKLENIVIDDHSDPKIIDFDLSVTKGSEDYGRGTLEFMDPVIIENWGKKRTVYNEFRDIYSLGVILYYLDQGTYPFEGSSRFGILNSIKNNYYKFTQGTDYDIIMIIESCLKLNEKKRKTLHEIIKMTEQALANLQNVKLKGALAISNIKNLPSWLIKFQNQPKESIFDASQSVEFWLLGLIILLAAFIALNYFVWPAFSSQFRLMFTKASTEQQGVETSMQHDETI